MSAVYRRRILDVHSISYIETYRTQKSKNKRSRDVCLKGKEKEAVQAFISSVFSPPDKVLISY